MTPSGYEVLEARDVLEGAVLAAEAVRHDAFWIALAVNQGMAGKLEEFERTLAGAPQPEATPIEKPDRPPKPPNPGGLPDWLLDGAQ